MTEAERQARIHQIMEESNSDELTAAEMLAMQLGESDGDCVIVDDPPAQPESPAK